MRDISEMVHHNGPAIARMARTGLESSVTTFNFEEKKAAALWVASFASAQEMVLIIPAVRQRKRGELALWIAFQS